MIKEIKDGVESMRIKWYETTDSKEDRDGYNRAIDHILHFIERIKPKWEDRPKTIGWYWYKDKSNKIMPVLICDDEHYGLFPSVLDVAMDFSDFNGTWQKLITPSESR